MSKTQRRSPAVQVLTWHRDQYYSFFIPNNWHKRHWSDGREGVIYAPDPNDPLTVFAVDFQDIGMSIAPPDLDILADGFFYSIEQLPQVNIESHKQNVTGSLLELEAKYTFTEQGQRLKRWTRVFYHETRQIAMTAQAASPEKYAHWRPWFVEAMTTTVVHNQKPQSKLSQ
jgi:hypothetical protein